MEHLECKWGSSRFLLQNPYAMKNNTHFKKLHTEIGAMIKEIAHRKGISSETIADHILCYQNNASKIYELDDMDGEQLIKISYFLE